MKKLFLIFMVSLLMLNIGCSSKKKKQDDKTNKQEAKTESARRKKGEDKTEQASTSQSRQRDVNIDSLIASTVESLGVNDSFNTDTTITSNVDSTEYKRIVDSLQKLADDDYDERQKEAKEKAEFINKEYKRLWEDAKEDMRFLAGNRTATQVRARAHQIRQKASEYQQKAEQFPEDDPRREVVESKADFYQSVSTRMSATGGNDTKMRILIQEIKKELQERQNPNIEIDY
ncbi:MAG: hypothetical protein ACLFSQ_07755 [Candidatus Zixiibacteriota bacterium]